MLRFFAFTRANTRSPLKINVSRGFTLIEIAIALFIIGIALIAVLKFSGGLRDIQNRTLIRTQLDNIDIALVNFVAINKRLPCPANGLLASGVAGAGVETLSPGPPPPGNPPIGNCNPTSQINGVLPWVSLGLTEADATDPWGGRMTYRVDPALAGGTPLPLLMNMSNCDPSSTGIAVGGACQTPAPPCTGGTGCTSPSAFLSNKGLDVWNGINGALGWAIRQNNRGNGTGAAYVVISHGPTGTGAYNKGGVLQPGSMGAGANETQNRNNNVVALPSALATTYRDAALDDIAGGAHFDDYLSHPTIMTVLNKANLGPRAH